MRRKVLVDSLIFWAAISVLTILIGGPWVAPWVISLGLLVSFLKWRFANDYSEDEFLACLSTEGIFANDLYTALCVNRGLGEHPTSGDPAFGWIYATAASLEERGLVKVELATRRTLTGERESEQYHLTPAGEQAREEAMRRLGLVPAVQETAH